MGIRIWVHLVWATKGRRPLLERGLRARLFEHIKENAERKGIYLDTIGGYLDHLHALISLGSDQTISKIAQLIKGESSYWINKNGLVDVSFQWQEEYYAISVSDSMIEEVRRYIQGQEEHHRKKSFTEEYQEFFERYGPRGGGLKSG